MSQLIEARFGHGRLVNYEQVRKRLDNGQITLGIEEKILFRLEPATLFDYKQLFNKASISRPHFAAGNVEASEGSFVPGAYLETTAVGAQILDKAEYVPEHYELKRAKVSLSDGSERKVLIYTAHPDKVLPVTHVAYGKPHPEYLLAILRGGKERGFPDEYLQRLASIVEDPRYIDYVRFIGMRYGDKEVLVYLNRLIAYVQEEKG